jgi:hypothetical protein
MESVLNIKYNNFSQHLLFGTLLADKKYSVMLKKCGVNLISDLQ